MVLLAATGPILLAAACSSSGSGASSPSASSSAPASALAFSHCMRSHGLPQFPDPDSSGTLPKIGPQQLGASSAEVEAAQQTCASLLQPSATQAQQTLSGMRDFAGCMRSHGTPNWPDPTTDNGQAVFDLHGRTNPDSQQSVTASDDCSHLLHPVPGQNGAVLCNGIGEPGCHHYG